jgi:hypothetical protein
MSKRALLLVSSFVVGAFGLSVAGPAQAERMPGSMPPFDAFPLSAPADWKVESVPDVIAGELVVDVKDDLSEEQIQELGNEYHLALRDNSPGVKDDGKVELATVDPASRTSSRGCRTTRVSRVSKKKWSRARSSRRTIRSSPISGT